MILFVDTSVWSLALRRDTPTNQPEVAALEHALGRGGSVLATGLVLQELFQGFGGPKLKAEIVRSFSVLPSRSSAFDEG